MRTTVAGIRTAPSVGQMSCRTTLPAYELFHEVESDHRSTLRSLIRASGMTVEQFPSRLD